jgi:MFS family permease
VLGAAVLGTGATFFDGDASTVALPAISADLRVATAGLQWIVNLILLVVASFLLIGASLADRYGRRRLFLAGSVAFAVASVIGGAITSVWSWRGVFAAEGGDHRHDRVAGARRLRVPELRRSGQGGSISSVRPSSPSLGVRSSPPSG